MSSLSHSWNTLDWKQKRAELLAKVDCCQWCGKHDGDTYTDTKGKKHKVFLSIHHIERPKYGLGLYRKVSAKLFRDYAETTQFKLDMYKIKQTMPLGIKEKEVKSIAKGKWQKENKATIKEAYEVEKAKIIEGYTNFDEKDVIVLCNRCHYAREKGLVLCKVCLSRYHKPVYEMCWSCSVLR